MGKLTSTQVAAKVGVTKYTLLKWYSFFEENPMKCEVKLPMYEVVQQGKNMVRLWEDEDIEKIELFKEWLPRGRGGIMSKGGQLNE